MCMCIVLCYATHIHILVLHFYHTRKKEKKKEKKSCVVFKHNNWVSLHVVILSHDISFHLSPCLSVQYCIYRPQFVSSFSQLKKWQNQKHEFYLVCALLIQNSRLFITDPYIFSCLLFLLLFSSKCTLLLRDRVVLAVPLLFGIKPCETFVLNVEDKTLLKKKMNVP